MTQTREQPSPLEALADELHHRGLRVRLIGDKLMVRIPEASRLGEDISRNGTDFLWSWDAPIGPLTDIAGVADRVQHVLKLRDQ